MSTDAPLTIDLTQLPDEVSLLQGIVRNLFDTVQEREARIRQLEQHIHLLVKRFTHPASEKIDPRQLLLFVLDAAEGDTLATTDAAAATTEAQSENDNQEKQTRKHTPHGRGRVPDTIERRQVIHDLTPAQKLVLGGEQNLVYVGEDVTCHYEWTPSSVIIVEHHQKKYVRSEEVAPMSESSEPAGNDPVTGEALSTTPDQAVPGTVENIAAPDVSRSLESAVAAGVLTPELAERFASPVIVAPKPPSVIPGGSAGPGLLAQVIVSKYADHLPLYRLETIFARQGVHFTRQTMYGWCAACARALEPLTELIREEVLRSLVIHTDDTPVKVRDAHAKEKFQGRFWTYYGDEARQLIWFEFTNTRKRAGPDRVLANYTGYLQADGYGGYDDYEGIELSSDSPILKVACWAHARRKFHDAIRTEPVPAQIALARIGQLYKIEKELRERATGEWQDLSLEARAALIAAERQVQAQPILDSFKVWLDERMKQALPKSPIATAIRYAQNQWSALVRYVEDGRLSIDNNAAERALRGIAIGRKNWLFCGSEAGGRTAAVLFTMLASAKRNNLDPWAYLRDVLTRLPTLGDKPPREALMALLPNHWQPTPAANPTAAHSLPTTS